MVIFIIPINIPLLFRPLPRAEKLVDLRHLFHREPFAEMLHHGRVEQRLAVELLQAEKILHVGVFLDALYRSLIRQVIVFFYENRPERDPGTQGRASGFTAQALDVDLFDAIPRHDARQTRPTVVLAQSAPKGQKELLHADLVLIFLVIHPATPPKSCLFAENTRF